MKNLLLVLVVVVACFVLASDCLAQIKTAGVEVSTVVASEVKKSTSAESASSRASKEVAGMQLEKKQKNEKWWRGWRFEIGTESADAGLDFDLNTQFMLKEANRVADELVDQFGAGRQHYPHVNFNSGNGYAESTNCTMMFGSKKSHWSFGFSSGRWLRITDPIHKEYQLQDFGWGDKYVIDVSAFKFSSQLTTFNVRYNFASVKGIDRPKLSCFLELRYGSAELEFEGKVKAFEPIYPVLVFPVEYDFVGKTDHAEVQLLGGGLEYGLSKRVKLELGGRTGVVRGFSYKEKYIPADFPTSLDGLKPWIGADQMLRFNKSELNHEWSSADLWQGQIRFYFRMSYEF